MRIAINLAAAKTASMTLYGKGLLSALARLAPDDQFLAFTSPQVARSVGNTLPSNFEQRVTPVTDRVGLRVLWEQTVLPLTVKQWRADVLFAAVELAPFLAPCPTLLAVHNASPHFDVHWKNRLRRWLSACSGQTADLVLFVSRCSAEFVGSRLHVPEDKRVVVYHGTDHSRWTSRENPEPVLQKYGIHGSPYLLFLSHLYRHKHPETLIEGFARWLKASGRRDHTLVLAGSMVDPVFGRELHALVQQLGISDKVQFLGLVPASDIPVLYQHATAFVLPTDRETFCLPFVEAMASGVPVICADTDVAREVCGDAALYFPVRDAPALAQALETVASQPDVRLRMIDHGRTRASEFTCDREAAETLVLLRSIAPRRRDRQVPVHTIRPRAR